MKPVSIRPLAQQDVTDAIDHYLGQAGPTVAFAFIAALEAAYSAVSHRPAAGSPRLGWDLALQGLRSKRLRRFPYLILYVEQHDHVDVWRVLHASRDLPVLIGEPEG